MIGREQYLDAGEAQKLRTVAEARAVADQAARRVGGVIDWMTIDLALSTGLRVSEIQRLNCGDVGFERGTLRVTRSKKRRKTKPELLALPAACTQHLRRFFWWKQVQRQPTGPEDPLIVGKRGRMGIRGLQRAWERSLARAGLIHCGIHGARHTVATHLLKATGNLRLVQVQLGHESPTTTANLYAHVSFEDRVEAIDRLYKGA